MASDWPLLTGGRYWEVVVRTGLTVLIVKNIYLFYIIEKALMNAG
jgi:hypothetical protein